MPRRSVPALLVAGLVATAIADGAMPIAPTALAMVTAIALLVLARAAVVIALGGRDQAAVPSAIARAR